MKGKIKKILSFILSCLIFACVPVMSACKKKPGASEPESVILTYTDIDLVANNASEYKIVIPAGNDQCVNFAAQELTEFFKEATGYTLNTVTDEAVRYDETQKIISIWETNAWKGAGIALPFGEFGYDGAFVTRRGNQIFLCGAAKYGALNAVYDFLQLQFNYEAYSVDEIYIDKVDNAKLLDFKDLKDIPAIRTRTSADGCVANNEIYAARLRNSYGGNGRRYGDKNGEYAIRAHTVQNILPFNTYGEQHRDWYSSTGSSTDPQVCIPKYFTDEEFKATFLANLKKKISDYPDSTAYQLGMNDSNDVHDRPETVAWTEEHGGYSGALMTFANAVARDIKAWLYEIGDPRAETYRISVLAYVKYETAPVKPNQATGEYEPLHPDVVAEDNVSVMLCPYYASNAYAMTDSEHNNRYKVLMDQWSVLTDKLEIWFYSTNFRNYMIPYNNFAAYRENCIGWANYGVTYVLENGGHAVKPFQNLKNYVYAKLMWDPYRDYNKLVDDFIFFYYKDAAPYIKEYYDLVRANYAVVEQQLAENSRSLSSGIYETEQQSGTTVFSLGYTKKINQILDKALQAAENIADPLRREKVLLRVKSEALSPRYFMVQLHSSSISKSETEMYINQFEEWAAQVGMTDVSENWRGVGTPAQIVAAWRERLNLVG